MITYRYRGWVKSSKPPVTVNRKYTLALELVYPVELVERK